MRKRPVTLLLVVVTAVLGTTVLAAPGASAWTTVACNTPARVTLETYYEFNGTTSKSVVTSTSVIGIGQFAISPNGASAAYWDDNFDYSWTVVGSSIYWYFVSHTYSNQGNRDAIVQWCQ